MNEQLKELIEELENCAEGIAIGRGESFSRAVEIAPLLLRKTVDKIKDILSENASIVATNYKLSEDVKVYKWMAEWRAGEIDRIIEEYAKTIGLE